MCGELSCDGCDRIVAGPASVASYRPWTRRPGLLAHVLVSKYADHLPLYRQSEIYAREGVDLDRSTLAGWVGATSELLAPLVDAVRQHVLSASKLHADDTPVPVLAPGNGKTKTEGSGPMFATIAHRLIRPRRPCGSAYSPDRKGERPKLHLKDYRGPRCRPMLTPASTISTKAERSTRSPVGLMRGASSTRSISPMLRRRLLKPSSGIAALYAIEAEIRGSTADVRKVVRQARARPLLDNMKTWLEATLAKLSRKSDTAAAIRYALSRWKALTRYANDGHLEIDNNAAERALRVVALGRKKLPLRRLRRPAVNALQPSTPAWLSQAQRTRPRTLSSPRHRTHRRPPVCKITKAMSAWMT